MRPWFGAALISSCLLGACHKEPVVQAADSCGPLEIPADATISAPRPEEAEADFTFPGNMPEQLEFVWIQPEGQYHYAERWNLGVAKVDRLQVNMGWDWKVSCQIERCEKPTGEICCFQTCENGGKNGVPTEPPDRFGCMNESAGGRYQWFLDGLRAAGIEGLEGCVGPPVSQAPVTD